MRIFIISVVLMLAGQISLQAQETPVSILDGLEFHIDSTAERFVTKQLMPLMFLYPHSSTLQNPATLMIPPDFETKEQRAQRINLRTFHSVMNAINRGMPQYRIPEMLKINKNGANIASLFLSNPFGFPGGCVPLMNASFPFIYAKTPGMTPYENLYTSQKFPRCIDTKYDFATGTYKQVMVNWSEVQDRNHQK